MSVIGSAQESLAKFFLDFGDALANPQNLLVDFTPQSWGLMVLFIVSRRISPLMEWIVQSTIDESFRKELKELKHPITVQFNEPMTLGDVASAAHTGSFFFEFCILFIMYVLDFWTFCEEREATAIRFGNATQQAFTTILPILAFFWWFHGFEWHKNLRKKVSILIDLFEGVLLFVIYNFAIHFQDVYDRMVCATFTEREIQQTMIDEGTSAVWRAHQRHLYETNDALRGKFHTDFDTDYDYTDASNKDRAEAALKAESGLQDTTTYTEKELEESIKAVEESGEWSEDKGTTKDTSTTTKGEGGTSSTTKDTQQQQQEEEDEESGPNPMKAIWIALGVIVLCIIIVGILIYKSKQQQAA